MANVTASLLNYHITAPIEGRRCIADKFCIELGLSPWHRTARASFPGHWKSTRFEKVGSLFLLPPGVEAVFRSEDSKPIRSVSIEFPAERVYEMVEPQEGLMDWHLVAGLDLRVPSIKALLVRLAEEVDCPGFASSIILDSIVAQLSVELVRHGNSLKDKAVTGGLSPWQLRKIDERLAQFGKAPTLLELATLCGISLRQLQRGFTASKGLTLGAYAIHNRIEQAKQLLANNIEIEEIASALGFSNASNFAFAFRREVGVTPSNYRRRFPKH